MAKEEAYDELYTKLDTREGANNRGKSKGDGNNLLINSSMQKTRENNYMNYRLRKSQDNVSY